MDRLDRQILAELQTDGRQSVTELAGHVGLTVSPTQRRVRDLERFGAIVGYRAIVDPQVLGARVRGAGVRHHEAGGPRHPLWLRGAVERIPNVLLAQRLFGDPDYLLRVRTTDLDAYARLEDDVLATLPGVQRLDSTLVMKNVVIDRPYPIDH